MIYKLNKIYKKFKLKENKCLIYYKKIYKIKFLFKLMISINNQIIIIKIKKKTLNNKQIQIKYKIYLKIQMNINKLLLRLIIYKKI